MRFLSLGAGVQSSVMMMLSIKGEIERPDHIIFADTGFEPSNVMRHVLWCKKQAEKAEIPFHIVKAKQNMKEEFEAFEKKEKSYWMTRPPLYVDADKGLGQLVRQCSRDAKIKPITRKQVELAGHKTMRTVKLNELEVMIGISTDEIRRASTSRDPKVDRLYPLIDPMKFSRNDCQSWWEEHYTHVPLPSSSCIICPYKTPRMFKHMKETQPEDFELACQYDERIREAYKIQKDQVLYVANDGKPLRDERNLDLQSSFDLEEDIYCSGGCGL